VDPKAKKETVEIQDKLVHKGTLVQREIEDFQDQLGKMAIKV